MIIPLIFLIIHVNILRSLYLIILILRCLWIFWIFRFIYYDSIQIFKLLLHFLGSRHFLYFGWLGNINDFITRNKLNIVLYFYCIIFSFIVSFWHFCLPIFRLAYYHFIFQYLLAFLIWIWSLLFFITMLIHRKT